MSEPGLAQDVFIAVPHSPTTHTATVVVKGWG